MTQTLRITHSYDAPPRAVWTLATDFDLFAEAMRGVVRFRSLPTGRMVTGQVIETQASLFGILPWRAHHITITCCNDDAMTFTSHERGDGLKRWIHVLSVRAEGRGAVLVDEIEIESERPLMTPAFAAWARYLYRRRHKPRLRMLAAMTDGET